MNTGQHTNTTLNQILQLDTYLRGGPQTPDERGLIEFDGVFDDGHDGPVRLDPRTGAIYDWRSEDPVADDEALSMLGAIHQWLFKQARKRVYDQHVAAATARATGT